jgi:hypothetical protein
MRAARTGEMFTGDWGGRWLVELGHYSTKLEDGKEEEGKRLERSGGHSLKLHHLIKDCMVAVGEWIMINDKYLRQVMFFTNPCYYYY